MDFFFFKSENLDYQGQFSIVHFLMSAHYSGVISLGLSSLLVNDFHNQL